MPTLAALAARGEVGRAAVIPPGLPPGSDVGNMSIIGYDPAAYTSARPAGPNLSRPADATEILRPEANNVRLA